MAKRLFQYQKLQAPSIRIRIFLKMEIFFSVLAFRLHVNGVFLAPKTQVFENGFRGEDFLKRHLLSFHANGRRRFSNTLMSYIIYQQHYACSVGEYTIIPKLPPYSRTPPYDHPVYKTTFLLRPYSFRPNVKTIEAFYYFVDPVSATTLLLRPGFYGPTVVALTGFHSISVFKWTSELTIQIPFLWTRIFFNGRNKSLLSNFCIRLGL